MSKFNDDNERTPDSQMNGGIAITDQHGNPAIILGYDSEGRVLITGEAVQAVETHLDHDGLLIPKQMLKVLIMGLIRLDKNEVEDLDKFEHPDNMNERATHSVPESVN